MAALARLPLGPPVRAGTVLAEEFAAGIVVEWELGLAVDAFLESFRSWMSGPVPGASELLAEVQRHVLIGCLSNMNALQWDFISAQLAVFDTFTYRFLSFELGMVKPDRELFDRIAESLPVSPDRAPSGRQHHERRGRRGGRIHRPARAGVGEARQALYRRGCGALAP